MWWQKSWWLSVALVSLVHCIEIDHRLPKAEARLTYSSISEKPTHALPGLLYPRESESREVKSLDGFWNFAVPPSNDTQKGHREKWFFNRLSIVAEVMKMPVPSSYNDITTSATLRDHVGPVWYERTFYVPTSWKNKRIFLRFGSVNYLAEVNFLPNQWLNGAFVRRHEMGHLPFEAEITSSVLYGEENRVTVAVDNTLGQTSVPQGAVVNATNDEGTIKLQTYTFDFFNYAGIHRPVLLHTKPQVFVADIDVHTSLKSGVGILKYNIGISKLSDSRRAPFCQVNLLDRDGEYVVAGPFIGTEGTMKLASPLLWWPRSMSRDPGYMYTLEVKVLVPNVTEPDIYRLPVGIRSLKWTNTSFLINDKPIYFRGFGRHEDSAIRGRGLDLVTTARDYELLKWVGANAYRTSHYPYSDEILDHADRMGIMIIDECPSANTENFSTTLLKKHKQSLSELIRRDKNRPSVVMWSIANEPRTQLANAGDYFKKIAHHTKTLDPSRPITTSINREVSEDKAGAYVDIISFNRYNGWYHNTGRLDMIVTQVINETRSWYAKYNKPVMMSEYGADTMPGLHELPEYVWSEEYQMKTMSRHFEAFDRLRAQGFFIGEFIWNFADFRTSQKYHRVAGNKKGLFTRDRQPKMAAYHVRRRYHALAAAFDDEAEMPSDLENYISSQFVGDVMPTFGTIEDF